MRQRKRQQRVPWGRVGRELEVEQLQIRHQILGVLEVRGDQRNRQHHEDRSLLLDPSYPQVQRVQRVHLVLADQRVPWVR